MYPLMYGRYVTDILKMCMKKFIAIFFLGQINRVLVCTLRGGGGGGGYSVSLACSQFLVSINL